MEKLKNRTLLFLVLCFVVGCSGKEGLMRDFDDAGHTPQGEQDYKVAMNVGSYNIRLLTNADQGDLAWANRKQWARKIVDDYDFDVLGTQEGYLSQIRDLVEEKDYDYVAVGRDDGKNQGETCAILFKKEKFTLLANGTFWLSTTPNEPSYGWDANIRRICTWVRLKEKEADEEFFVFNVHYDHQGTVARGESSRLMLNKIREIAGNGARVFMTGDLNAEPNAEPITVLLGDNILWDSRILTQTPPTGPEGTSYGYNLNTLPTSRIDYVFVTRSISVLSYVTIDDDFTTGNIASDHLPVLIKAAW
ncbi:endonuclease/exonuclease/phosphatase family protein [Sphingobacterium gobiense]|uniref:Endonuclease n=1 Tax=Sphingobacterium gobiense TaxID=1382456 RepID=A0A2S9JD49_9SPHI|nr:endonuclease/exonuclease/phosphatase family protein [Sphingobacterium gobiense]PRD50805.1 endonuclease [Sphingobacterium gobiense]